MKDKLLLELNVQRAEYEASKGTQYEAMDEYALSILVDAVENVTGLKLHYDKATQTYSYKE